MTPGRCFTPDPSGPGLRYAADIGKVSHGVSTGPVADRPKEPLAVVGGCPWRKAT